MSSHACNGYLKGEPAMRGLHHALTPILNWPLRQGQPKRIRKSHFDGNIKPLLENSLTYACERRGMWVKGNHGTCVYSIPSLKELISKLVAVPSLDFEITSDFYFRELCLHLLEGITNHFHKYKISRIDLFL